MQRAEVLASSIAVRLGMCSYDELRVFDVMLERILKLGRDSYSPLDLARDQRDWSKEAADELADTLFYLACREVAANDRRLERLRCEVADEIANTSPIEKGLAELRDAEPITAPRPLLEFDMSDVDAYVDLGGEGGS